MITRRAITLGLAALPIAANAQTTPRLPSDWAETLRQARGQTVYFNAWGGDEQTNAFIAWAGDHLRQGWGVDLRHVKLGDTAEAVTRVVAEKAAGRTQGGSVDLIWINGPNFLAMKQQSLLFGPVVERLPNAAFVDWSGKPSNGIDFTVPTDGLEVPWRLAQVVFVYDPAHVPEAPRSMPAMLEWARANPGRTTHPNVRNFMGVTYLKQALYELCSDPGALLMPVTDASYAAGAAPLWAWYDELRPLLWRKGIEFPANGPAQKPLLLDGEIDIYITFNPSEASLAIDSGELPPSVRTFVLTRGTIGNTSFVAIPFNAAHQAGAMITANFLLSPEAQAHAQDPRVLGNFTVLNLTALPQSDQAMFAALPRGPATLTNAELGRPLLEPHASWMTRITSDWQTRYGS